MERDYSHQSLSVAILVVSCDAYSDLWSPFFALLRRFWHPLPYPVHLLTNHAQPEFDGVNVIPVGDDLSWSDNLLSALSYIKEEYVILMLEDLMLCGEVNQTLLYDAIQSAIANDAKYLRLTPSIPPDTPFNNHIGIVSRGTVYRASVVMPMFKTSHIRELLKSGENAWEFEYFGSQRSDAHDGYYSTYRNCIPHLNTVIKRVWEYRAAQTVLRLGVQPDFNKRRVMNYRERVVWNYKLFRTRVFHLVPPQFRRTVKEFIAGKKPSV
ncbi:MAG: hypothetical protein JNL32_15875 [Candidatus Kapabacteria bacterium]|nr:hypothetical protein [Candidatus Kapabacteria bacterium]